MAKFGFIRRVRQFSSLQVCYWNYMMNMMAAEVDE